MIIRIDSVTNIAVCMGPADNYYKNRGKSPKWYFAGLMGRKNPKHLIMKFLTFSQIKNKTIIKTGT